MELHSVIRRDRQQPFDVDRALGRERRRICGMKELTTTSYALLAHLAVRPWPAYELVGQMTRGLDLIWPRAERGIYTEPKNLVAHGLARARRDRVSRNRIRTVYEITAKGRRALRDWLEQPTAAPRLESEPLVRTFFAEHGSPEALLRTLDACVDRAAEVRGRLREQIAGYLKNGGPFPERWHVIAVGSRYLLDEAELLDRWARWARNEVETWPSTSDPSAQRGPELLRQNLERASQHFFEGEEPR